VNRDNNPDQAPSYPFTSQIAAIQRNGDNSWSQSLAGNFPDLVNAAGEPLSYGTSSVFIPLEPGQDRRVRYLAEGVLDLDRLQRRSQPGESVLVGYVVVASNRRWPTISTTSAPTAAPRTPWPRARSSR
jgi:hypothetical protein